MPGDVFGCGGENALHLSLRDMGHCLVMGSAVLDLDKDELMSVTGDQINLTPLPPPPTGADGSANAFVMARDHIFRGGACEICATSTIYTNFCLHVATLSAQGQSDRFSAI